MPDIIRGDHDWVGAAIVKINKKQVSRAHRRGTIKVLEEQQIDVLEVYCKACKRPYDDCNGTTCVVGDHLRGGPIGERKKRKPAPGSPEAATQAPDGP